MEYGRSRFYGMLPSDRSDLDPVRIPVALFALRNSPAFGQQEPRHSLVPSKYQQIRCQRITDRIGFRRLGESDLRFDS